MKKEKIVCRGCGLVQDLKIENNEDYKCSNELIFRKIEFGRLRTELKNACWFKKAFFKIDRTSEIADIFLRKNDFNGWIFNRDMASWNEWFDNRHRADRIHRCKCGHTTGFREELIE